MLVWGTLKDIVALCLREWRTALKFGAVPVTVNIVLVIFFTEVAPQSFAAYARSWSISLISILVFAPFCVAWYRMILYGPAAVAARPVFTVTLLELRFFGWMLLISVLSALLAIILTLVSASVVVLLSMTSETAAAIAGITLALGSLTILLMAISRWSIGLAMVASGEKMNLMGAWAAARPYGWAMAGVQIIIFVVIAVIAGAFLAGILPDFIQAVRTQTAASERSQIIVQLTGTISGALALWLSTTMYALVYRKITPHAGFQEASAPIAD
jgi:hypothetical protein